MRQLKPDYVIAKLYSSDYRLLEREFHKRNEESARSREELNDLRLRSLEQDKELNKLPKRGIRKLDVISPSFVIDNLETLEEINIEGRHNFLAAGGEEFNYIPWLNYRKDWVELLNHLSKK